jgi:drug/metabolite transporter (DMT)-like permease
MHRLSYKGVERPLNDILPRLSVLRTYTAFILLGIFWGSNFIYMKWASELISAGQISFLRVFFGLLPLAFFAWRKKIISLRQMRHSHHFVLLASVGTAFYYFAVAKGAAVLPSGIAGVLGASPPLFTAIAAILFLRNERMNGLMMCGVALGLAGITLISRPWTVAYSDAGISLAGVAWILGSSFVFGLSSVYIRLFLTRPNIGPLAIVTWQMGLALIVQFCLTDFSGVSNILSDWRAAIGLVVGLGLLGTGAALYLYYLLLDELSAVAAAGAIYITPIVALLIGWAAGEHVGMFEVAAVSLIFCSLALLEVGRKKALVVTR